MKNNNSVNIIVLNWNGEKVIIDCLKSINKTFYKNKEIDELENNTQLSFHKGSIHCGSFSKEKIKFLFEDKKIESIVVATVVLKDEIGLLKLGSCDRTRYLGDEDTTFIEYIRDILERKLAI